jgi:Uncharacterized conserved protein
MKEELGKDLITAMKEKDKDTLNTLRAVKGAVQLEVINNKKEDNNELYEEVVNKQIKLRKDSIKEFEKGNRTDLIESYQKEINILEKYMPKQLTDDELNNIINDVFEKVKPESIKDFGNIMKEITPLVKNKCDMGKLNILIKEKIK